MWKQFLDFSKQVIAITQKSRQHEADIKVVQEDVKELRNEVRALAQMFRDMQWERKYDRDMAVRDRENLILQLKVDLLSSGRSLPPPESDEKAI